MNATYFNHETTMESIVGGWKHHILKKRQNLDFLVSVQPFLKFIYLHSTIVSCYELTHHQTFYSWVNCPGHI